MDKKNLNNFTVFLFWVNNKEGQGKTAEKSQWALIFSYKQVYSAARNRLPSA